MGATLTLKSAIRTAEKAGTGPGTASVTGSWQLPGLIDARVKVLLDTYTSVGSGEDAGSVITFGTLPTGANILSVVIFSNNSTSSLTVSVGDANSATRYGTALTSLQTAGRYSLAASGNIPGYIVGTNLNTITGLPDDANITFTTAGAALASGYIYGVEVTYSFD